MHYPLKQSLCQWCRFICRSKLYIEQNYFSKKMKVGQFIKWLAFQLITNISEEQIKSFDVEMFVKLKGMLLGATTTTTLYDWGATSHDNSCERQSAASTRTAAWHINVSNNSYKIPTAAPTPPTHTKKSNNNIGNKIKMKRQNMLYFSRFVEIKHLMPRVN